jgi:hypothetical protein
MPLDLPTPGPNDVWGQQLNATLQSFYDEASKFVWTKKVDADPMATNTQWTNHSGTWTFGQTYGVDQTSTTQDSWLRYTPSLDSNGLRIIKTTLRSTGGTIVGVGFSGTAGWTTGSLGIGLDLSGSGTLWWDRYGSGGGNKAQAMVRNQDYVLTVVEKVAKVEFWVYLDGVKVWELMPSGGVTAGGVGLYCRSGQGSFRNVSIWEGLQTGAALPPGVL